MKLPQALYVKIEGEGDDAFFNPSASLDDHAAVGEKVKVGVYQLVETVVVETVIERRSVKS